MWSRRSTNPTSWWARKSWRILQAKVKKKIFSLNYVFFFSIYHVRRRVTYSKVSFFLLCRKQNPRSFVLSFSQFFIVSFTVPGRQKKESQAAWNCVSSSFLPTSFPAAAEQTSWRARWQQQWQQRRFQSPLRPRLSVCGKNFFSWGIFLLAELLSSTSHRKV